MSLLEKIRNKSEGEKVFLAFWIALVVTIVLVTFWAFNLQHTLKSNEDVEQTASPISAVSARIKDVFSGGREVYQAK